MRGDETAGSIEHRRPDVDLNFAELTTLERYKLLTGLVFPRPIAWVSTWGEDGVANCALYSFFNASGANS